MMNTIDAFTLEYKGRKYEIPVDIKTKHFVKFIPVLVEILGSPEAKRKEGEEDVAYQARQLEAITKRDGLLEKVVSAVLIDEKTGEHFPVDEVGELDPVITVFVFNRFFLSITKLFGISQSFSVQAEAVPETEGSQPSM